MDFRNILCCLLLISSLSGRSQNGSEVFTGAYEKYNSGDFAGAIEDYTAWIEMAPEDASAHFNRGLAYFYSGLYAEAANDFETVVSLSPSDYEAYYYAGSAYANTDMLSSAQDAFTKSIYYNPSYQPAFLERGFVKYRMENYTGAIADFKEAASINRNDADALFNMAACAMHLRYYDEVIDACTSLIAIYPNDARAYYLRGNAFYYLFDDASACADWQQAASLGDEKAASDFQKNCAQ